MYTPTISLSFESWGVIQTRPRSRSDKFARILEASVPTNARKTHGFRTANVVFLSFLSISIKTRLQLLTKVNMEQENLAIGAPLPVVHFSTILVARSNTARPNGKTLIPRIAESFFAIR